ncbi:MAG: hypothetical protein COA57_13605 [Flavobacteriales bacterium]|nr:MAG: hypothetical protein COA57_13605 [Flavobacteriales bacterium]
MKLLKKILVFLIIALLLFTIAGIIITHFYKDEVKEYIIAEINKNLQVEAKSTIEDLTIFERFPYASLSLKDVVIPEVIAEKQQPDTLLYIEKIHLQLNLVDILQKRYNIKSIDAENGFFRMKIDKRGNENFIFWKKREGSSESSFLLDLEQVNVSNMQISYRNKLKSEDYQFTCNTGELSGAFSNQQFEMDMSGDVFVAKLISDNVNYINRKNLSIETKLTVDKSTNTYTFNSGRATIENKLNFEIEGTITDEKDFSDLNLKITGKDLNMVAALGILPKKFSRLFLDYESAGNLYFELTISGASSKKHHPSVQAKFNVENGIIRHKQTNYMLNEVYLTGVFSNGKRKNATSSRLEFTEIKAKLGKGIVKSTVLVENFNKPKATIFLSGNMLAQDLQQFIKSDTIENISGEISVDINYEGLIPEKEGFTAADFKKVKISGTVELKNAQLQLKSNSQVYENLHGTLEFQNSNVKIDSLRGHVAASDFYLSGFFHNALPFMFFEKEKLTAKLKVHSDNIDLNELLRKNNAQSSDTIYAIALPERVSLQAVADIKNITFRRFNATDLKGKFRYENNRLWAEKVAFAAMRGKMTASGKMMKNADGNILASLDANVQNIDINQLFYQMENFGQKVIQEENLKGIGTANIRFSCMMDSTLNIQKETIYTKADLTIEQGELIGFEPLKAISDYIKTKKLYSKFLDANELEKKLQHIKFSALQNQIEIRDETIFMPFMEINSSALDIETKGTHTFDNKIDYQINFYLSDLLAKKSKGEHDLWEIREDGTKRRKIFLNMYGSVENPEFKHNKSEYKKHLKQEVNSEKKIVKELLKEEFNLFTNDTSVTIPKQQEDDFDIEWEESKVEDKREKPKKEQPKEKKKLKGIFNLEENEEETEEFNPDE